MRQRVAGKRTVSWNPVALIVARTPKIVAHLCACVTDAGLEPVVADSYLAGRKLLDEREPAALLTEVRLAEYNGLQLALRAYVRKIPTVLIGMADPILQREAEALRATYLTEPVEPQRILSVVAAATAEAMTSAILRRGHVGAGA